MKRLLCLVSGMNAGGAETFLMKVYRGLDRQQYQMDFCINIPEKCFYEDEIISMGGKIFRIPSKSQNMKAFSRQLRELVKSEKYEYALRITSNAMGFWDMKLAKQAGAKICAIRSSNSSDGGTLRALLAHTAGRLLYSRYIDIKLAPSDLAARYTFGRRSYENGEVTILHNAVDLDVFFYDEEKRNSIRAELGVLPDDFLVGHIGRFYNQKNHAFLLKVFAEILHQQPNSHLLLVGKGDLEQQIRQQAKDMAITDKVIFAGVRSDIPQILSAMDVFVFPSLYEGMPNTVIEAQATGLHCVIADTITREADITGLVEYLPLSAPEHWAQLALAAAKQPRRDTRQDFIDHRYDIQSTVDDFVKLCFGET